MFNQVNHAKYIDSLMAAVRQLGYQTYSPEVVEKVIRLLCEKTRSNQMDFERMILYGQEPMYGVNRFREIFTGELLMISRTVVLLNTSRIDVDDSLFVLTGLATKTSDGSLVINGFNPETSMLIRPMYPSQARPFPGCTGVINWSHGGGMAGMDGMFGLTEARYQEMKQIFARWY